MGILRQADRARDVLKAEEKTKDAAKSAVKTGENITEESKDIAKNSDGIKTKEKQSGTINKTVDEAVNAAKQESNLEKGAVDNVAEAGNATRKFVGEAADEGKNVEEAVKGTINGESTDGLKSTDDIIKSIENGDISLTDNMQKGNYGEMKMDAYYESKGYERISVDKVTDLNAPTHKGIDGVYYNPDGNPPYIIGEAKYGSAKLSKLKDGTKQMSDEWIEGGKTSSRLELSVGKEKADDILLEGYERELVNVSTNGVISMKHIDSLGKIVK